MLAKLVLFQWCLSCLSVHKKTDYLTFIFDLESCFRIFDRDISQLHNLFIGTPRISNFVVDHLGAFF